MIRILLMLLVLAVVALVGLSFAGQSVPPGSVIFANGWSIQPIATDLYFVDPYGTPKLVLTAGTRTTCQPDEDCAAR